MHSDILDEDEYDSDELALLVLNFNEFARRASIAVSRMCTGWRKLTKGRFHEIFVLFFTSDYSSRSDIKGGDVFETEWGCIARISRETEKVEILMSEMETMQHVHS